MSAGSRGSKSEIAVLYQNSKCRGANPGVGHAGLAM